MKDLNKELDKQLEELDNDSNTVREEKYQAMLEKIRKKVEAEKNQENIDDTLVLKNDEILEEINGRLDNDDHLSDDHLEKTFVIDRGELEKELRQDDEVKQNQIEENISYANIARNEEEALYKDVVLEVLGVKKRIGMKTIVEDITFDMKKGEITGLLGPNGSGKTTIMRMMVGLTRISSGDIYCFERPLSIGNTEMLSEVGSMIESPEFYNYLSGYANLKQIARLSGKEISKTRIKELIEFVGLEKVANKKVKTYSLGMRQRLGLAQALLHDPKILILDEPVNGLDPQGVQEFRHKLKEIAASGVSILISSHLLDELEKVCDRIIVLEKGKIVVDDTLDNLKSGDVIKTLIHTYDNERAKDLLKYLGLAFELTEEGFVFENISREDKAKVISYLTTNYIEIDTVRVVHKTLEDRFLEITGKGGL